MKLSFLAILIFALPFDLHISPSVGLTQRIDVDNYVTHSGISYKLLAEMYISNYFGFGVDIGKYNLSAKSNISYNRVFNEDNLYLSLNLNGSIPIKNNFSLIGKIGFGFNNVKTKDVYSDDFNENMKFLNIGISINYLLKKYLKFGISFDEQLMEDKYIYYESNGWPNIFIYRTYSIYLGYII